MRQNSMTTTSKHYYRISGCFLRVAATVFLAGLLPLAAHAADDNQTDPAFSYVPESIWINPGELSYHFNRSAGYREDNWGFGAQLNYPHNIALLGGTFINSDRQRSHDFGILWQPYEFGAVKLGGVVGAFDGYPYMEHGAWFPAALPMASVAYQRFGANLTIVPNYKNRLHGAVVVQLIFKVW